MTFFKYKIVFKQCFHSNTSNINSIVLWFLQLDVHCSAGRSHLEKNKLGWRLSVSHTSLLPVSRLREDSQLAHEEDSSD